MHGRRIAEQGRRPADAAEPAAQDAGPAHRVLALQHAIGNRAFAASLPPAPAVLARSPAEALVAEHTGMWGATLDEIGLANDLLKHLPGDPGFVQEVLDAVDWMNRDDISYEIAINLTDPKAKDIARSSDGTELLLRMTREMQGGNTFEAEEAQVERLLQLVSDTRNEGGGPIEVSVITFTSGHPAFDFVGGVVGGISGEATRGHTAIAVGGLAYSFENGWSAGLTKDAYLSQNSWRSGIELVLGIPREDALKLQQHLNTAVEEGLYVVGGDICVDATSRELEEVLEGLDATGSWDVIGFMDKLRKTGAVTAEIEHPAED